MSPKQKGELAEQIITCEFMKLGIAVSKPIGDNQPYDLIVDIKDRLYKIQCRTGRIEESKSLHTIVFNCLSCRINMKGIYRKDNRDKFDFFAIYFPGTEKVYLIDSKKVTANMGRFSLKEKSQGSPLAIDCEIGKQIKIMTD